MAKLLAIALACAWAGAFVPAWAQSWLTSTGPKVRLDISQKYATKNYNVQFVVTYAGKKYTCAKEVTADQTVAVVFPDDFDGGTQDGTYKWQAIVKGKAVLSGWFEYKSVGKMGKCGYQDTQLTSHLDCPK